jgi:hypothetical protein
MARVLVYCEGETEEAFVNRILKPFLLQKGIYLTASSCGGVSKYSRIKSDIITFCRDKNAVITTMLDYYGLPSDTPGMRSRDFADIYQKVSWVEDKMREDIGTDNFLPNLMLHEFETLLFSEPKMFVHANVDPRVVKELCKIRENSISPEHINDHPNKAPSKRIIELYPSYQKLIDGCNIAQQIGIDKMLEECKHFNNWIKKLSSLNPRPVSDSARH